MTIGESIKSARLAKGLNQTQLAAAIGTQTPTISFWETGRTFPSILNCISLADYLNITLDELVGRKVSENE